MLSKSALFALALSLLATASPNPQFQERSEGVSIDLPHRRSLTRENGVFDRSEAIKHTQRMLGKHRRNMDNFERNVAGGGVQDTAPTDLNRRHYVPAVPLTDELDDTEWLGPISIGTPGKRFLIDFDTGSSDLWVPSSSCNSSICQPRSKYDPKKSVTSRRHNGEFKITYGDNSSVSGDIFTDTVNVAGVGANNQFFSAVTNMSALFDGDPLDGILGMGFPALASLNQTPWFNNAVYQGSTMQARFAFKLATNSSSLTLGGVNKRLFNGDIETHKVIRTNRHNRTEFGYWKLDRGSVHLGSETVLSDFETVIDSGTTIMYGPPDEVAKVYAKIPGSKFFDPADGLYSFPCSSVPSISFDWGGRKWAVGHNNFNLGQVEDGSPDCVGALGGLDTGLGNNTWLLGDSFMKNVYTVFSFEDRTVGFAQLA